mgnify:CR=1 FL=1
MNGHEPEMGNGGLENRIETVLALEPVEKGGRFTRKPVCLGGLEMNPLAAMRPRDHLHQPGRGIAPCSDNDPPHAASSGGEQGRMPAEQPFFGERCREILRGIEHHLDDTLDIAIGWGEPADIHAKPAGDGGTNLFPVEPLALDLAGFDDILGEGAQDGLGAQIEAERFHAADQSALAMTHRRQPVADERVRPGKTGPAVQLVNIDHGRTSFAKAMILFGPQGKSIRRMLCGN